MQMDVADNPNCAGSEQMVYHTLGPEKTVSAIRIEEQGKETLCEVTGVESDGRFIKAKVAKIADSGAGFAFLIFGGAWGIRLKPETYAAEAWDLSNKHQWGEPYKIYGSENDIIFS